jgi:phytoene dehydrogenase-like protein
MRAIIVHAGVGGLTTALFLNKYGIDCEVFEQARRRSSNWLWAST